MPSFPTADVVLKVALAEVGATENPPGSNRTKYGAWFGMDGVSWCGIWVAWVFARAGVDLRAIGIKNPEYTPSFRNQALQAGWKAILDADIQAGDLLFYDFEPPYGTPGIQHIEFARGRPSGGLVPTVGGNTSSGSGGSQDNGGGVFKRTRPLDVIVAAIRPPYGQEDDVTPDECRAIVRAEIAAALKNKANLGDLAEAVWGVHGRNPTPTAWTLLNTAGRAPAPPTAEQLATAITAQLKALPAGTATLDPNVIQEIAGAVRAELGASLATTPAKPEPADQDPARHAL